MKQCPSCRAELYDDARFCIFCAEPVDEKKHIEIRRFGKGRTILRVTSVCVCAAAVVFTVTVGALSVRRNSEPPLLPEPESETAVTVNAETELQPEDTGDESTAPDATVTDGADTTLFSVDETTNADVTVMPGTDASPTDVPETAPETTVPETTGSEITDPETTAQKTTVPDTTRPETTAPVITVPETTLPETTIFITTNPETTEPETEIPDTTDIVTIDEVTVEPIEPSQVLATRETFGDIRTGLPENACKTLWWDFYDDDRWIGYLFERKNNVKFFYWEYQNNNDRVFLSKDGKSIAFGRYAGYEKGDTVPLFLNYSLLLDKYDSRFKNFESEFEEHKRPAKWEGLLKEIGISDEYYTEEKLLQMYGENREHVERVDVIGYKYWTDTIQINGATVRITIERQSVQIIYYNNWNETVGWSGRAYNWFGLVEIVDG